MKRVFSTIILIALMSVMLGCSSGDDENTDDRPPQFLEWVDSEAYELSGTYKGITPSGIAVCQDSVIISDMADNCLIEFDLNGHELRRIGQLGNGEGEFIRPTGLTYSNGILYVLDSGNLRIQLLDGEFKYKGEYELDPLKGPEDIFYSDVAIGPEGSGFVITNSINKDDARAYIVDADGSVHKTDSVINGYAGCGDNSVYCMNTYKLSTNTSSGSASIRGSILYGLVNDKVCEICEMPYKYGPTDFVIEGDDLYVLSCGWGELDHFKTDGSYVETIWKFDSLSYVSYLARTEQNGFVVTDGHNGTVYFIGRKSN